MSNESIHDYLSGHEFFSGLNEEFTKFLAQCAKELRMQKGAALFRQGEPAEKFYLLREGRVSVQIPALMGPPIEIQNLGEGEVLGWSWLIPPYRWNFQARAEEDSVVLEFNGRAILEQCEQHPKFGYELLKRFAALMSERLDAARRKMMDEWNPSGFA
ncbi:MAG: Crp/Fnr family transcriptional regulator [Acidiferrobacterales bacterium]